MKAEKIIVKREKEGNYIIFFPESFTKDNRYQLQHYTSIDGHGYSLDKEYYNICTPVGYTDVDVLKFVDNYVKYVRTLPDMQEYTVKLCKRITRK